MKLQDAHAAETGAAGNWANIGYIAPGSKTDVNNYSTTVFDYSGAFNPATSGTTMVGSISGATEGWRATAKTALNDCKISSYWMVKFNKAGNGAALSFEASITDLGSSSDNTNCKSLTANFTNIGHD
ncbi:hypothetical protein [Fibrobacter sp.]|uniref:hypothetical protein n=1 Tax=Fibrobacter sp. TaxID=35828 RepID=UPI0025BCB397|nr:hypothetical protein [Fibrobacter sp.]MBR3071801.1 hypothetical protein [Fibrobacter sp.]